MLYRWCYKTQSLAKALLLKYFMERRKKEDEKHIQIFFENYLQSAEGIQWTLFYSVLWPVTNLGHALQSISAWNFLPAFIRGIRNKTLEAGSRMRRWAGETCNWLSGCVMKGQLDTSAPSPGPGSHPMSLKMKLGVCFLHCLWHKVFTDLTVRPNHLSVIILLAVRSMK